MADRAALLEASGGVNPRRLSPDEHAELMKLNRVVGLVLGVDDDMRTRARDLAAAGQPDAAGAWGRARDDLARHTETLATLPPPRSPTFIADLETRCAEIRRDLDEGRATPTGYEPIMAAEDGAAESTAPAPDPTSRRERRLRAKRERRKLTRHRRTDARFARLADAVPPPTPRRGVAVKLETHASVGALPVAAVQPVARAREARTPSSTSSGATGERGPPARTPPGSSASSADEDSDEHRVAARRPASARTGAGA